MSTEESDKFVRRDDIRNEVHRSASSEIPARFAWFSRRLSSIGLCLVFVIAALIFLSSTKQKQAASETGLRETPGDDDVSVTLPPDDSSESSTPPSPPPTQAPISTEELLKHADPEADKKAGSELAKQMTQEEVASLFLNLTRDISFLPDYAEMVESIENWTADCDKEKSEIGTSELRRKLWAANCGGDYVIPEPQKAPTKPWRIGLLGNWGHGVYEMSGCHIGRKCPTNPNCEVIKLARHDFLRPDINLILTPSADHHLAASIRKKSSTISVLYWREALWGSPPSVPIQQHYFQLLMGVHHFASIKNPAFITAPYFLQQQLYAGTAKRYFAASIISDCETKSHREVYVQALVKALGEDRIHRFGSCGNRKFPNRPLANGYKLLAQYKFYLSFENTIQTGYSTEKLFQVMALPLIPVYYGDPRAPNITRTPSYIRASDFANPRSLANYLLYLDSNPTEYARYHSWRYEENPYEDSYLRAVSRVPGPVERKLHAKGGPIWMADRRASCCRLCDEPWLRKLMAERDESGMVRETMGVPRIKRVFYKGHPVAFPTPAPIAEDQSPGSLDGT